MMNDAAIKFAEELVDRLAHYAPKKQIVSSQFVQQIVPLLRSKEHLEQMIYSDADATILQLIERAISKGFVFTEEPPFSTQTSDYTARKDGYAVALREGAIGSDDKGVFCFSVIVQGAKYV